MRAPKPDPVVSISRLRDRIDRLFERSALRRTAYHQGVLALDESERERIERIKPTSDIREFMNFVVDTVPDGDVYLFGGLLRDIALFGKRGFDSDVDLVVDGGDWKELREYLETLGGKRNKFGGYRIVIAGWPVDIWRAKDTWAIAQGLVQYRGIGSLTRTTILNWDAILMNWRTRGFVFREKYLEELQSRMLDVVLEENPNPKGMAVRVFRHLCLKDAQGVTPRAAKYLARCASKYSFDELVSAEKKSYGTVEIRHRVYVFFNRLGRMDGTDIGRRWAAVANSVKGELDL